MPSAYPGAIDNFTNPTAADNLNTATKIHHDQHTNVNDAVKAVETELGINPKGASASVAARLAALDAAIGDALSVDLFHQPFGVATLDAGGKLVEDVDAARMSSGTLAVARIPNISGAKVLGVGSGGAAVPLDAVPNLPASKTNSGVFDPARIPQLNATTAFSAGTIPAARLPTSVTANANVRVVADAAERDTIPLVDRANGMLVWTRTSPPVLYMWNTSTNAWDTVPGGDEQIQRDRWLTADYASPVSAGFGIPTGFSWTVKAGRTYGFSGMIIATNTGSSSPGVQFGWSWSGNGLMSWTRHGIHSGVNAPSFVGDLNSIAVTAATGGTSNDPSAMSAPAGLNLGYTVEGTYECTADGTINFRVAQGVSNASFPVTVRRGSRMSCRRMIQ